MSNQEDDRSLPTASSGLLVKLLRALFEETSGAPQRDEREAVEHEPPHQAPNAELEAAALATLREVLARELGASAAEFVLQVEALAEVVPDLDTRRRAALSVLERKGSARPQLCRELTQALTLLDQQQRLFLEKLQARREENTTLAAQVEHDCRAVNERTSREIERLQSALEAQREAREQATKDREQRLQALVLANQSLNESELSFANAYQHLQREYRTLCEQLAQLCGEKL